MSQSNISTQEVVIEPLAVIPGWIEVTGYRQIATTGTPPIIPIMINKSNIVSIRKIAPDTCRIHVVSQVDYHIAMTYEQVVAKL